MTTVHIRTPEEYKKIFEESKLAGYDAILLISRDIFLSQDSFRKPDEYEKYFESLSKKAKERLGDFTYFYYHTVRPWERNSGKHTVRDESRLVAITSIMEKLMSKEEHLDFFSWFSREYPKENTIEDLKGLREKYLKDFGVHRKFREYMRSYVVDSNRDELLGGIEVFEEKDFRPIRDIEEATKMLYSMRSDFVHNAKMATFTSPNSFFPLTTVIDGTAYRFMMDIEYYMIIFERSFTKYWLEQVEH